LLISFVAILVLAVSTYFSFKISKSEANQPTKQNITQIVENLTLQSTALRKKTTQLLDFQQLINKNETPFTFLLQDFRTRPASDSLKNNKPSTVVFPTKNGVIFVDSNHLKTANKSEIASEALEEIAIFNKLIDESSAIFLQNSPSEIEKMATVEHHLPTFKITNFSILENNKTLHFNQLNIQKNTIDVFKFKKDYPFKKVCLNRFLVLGGLAVDKYDNRTNSDNGILNSLTNRLNFGVGFRHPIGERGWYLRAEVWRTQIRVPRVTWEITQHFDLDGSRSKMFYNKSFEKMSGFSGKIMLDRTIWSSFRALAGLNVSYISKIYWGDTYGGFGNSLLQISVDNSKVPPKPSFAGSKIRRLQAGPTLGIEKHVYKNTFLGVSITQNLIDYTRNNGGGTSGGYHIQRNFFFYLGWNF
jgi:hypothetical protein